MQRLLAHDLFGYFLLTSYGIGHKSTCYIQQFQ